MTIRLRRLSARSFSPCRSPCFSPRTSPHRSGSDTRTCGYSWPFSAFFALPAHALIGRWPVLKRLFLSSSQVDEEVREAAVTAFFADKLYKTREENGILIFISVLEHRVWVLADSGINSRINPGQWQEIVDHITSGIRQKRQGEAICEAIARVGDILREHFPISTDDHNELHNLTIR